MPYVRCASAKQSNVFHLWFPDRHDHLLFLKLGVGRCLVDVVTLDLAADLLGELVGDVFDIAEV